MMVSRWRKLTLAIVALVLVIWAIAALNTRDEPDLSTAPATAAPTAQQIARGAYLARAGNCQSCHTQAGGALYAGGEGIKTPFGVVYASNLTPDVKTGLGNWSAAHFWRAMHNGRSKDGRLLYPAFPYPQFSRITRDDSDAIFMYLRSLPAVAQPNKTHALSFPYNTQAALAVWRALYFSPSRHEVQPEKSAQWNRGSYLVQGLGHCAACHSPRNVLGATTAGTQFSGGAMPAQKWIAPSLLSAHEASVANWPSAQVAALLQAGVAEHGRVNGPMARVVFGSTQYLTNTDLNAMATYLKDLPQGRQQAVAVKPADAGVMQRGAKIYDKHCANCHGEQGQGVAGVYPQLTHNRLVTMQNPVNLIRVVLEGGFAPVTEKNPRPYGMPPFGYVLENPELADMLSFIRQSWGNRAPAVSELDVMQAR